MTEAGRQAEGTPKVSQSRLPGPETPLVGLWNTGPQRVFPPKGRGRCCGGGSALRRAVGPQPRLLPLPP